MYPQCLLKHPVHLPRPVRGPSKAVPAAGSVYSAQSTATTAYQPQAGLSKGSTTPRGPNMERLNALAQPKLKPGGAKPAGAAGGGAAATAAAGAASGPTAQGAGRQGAGRATQAPSLSGQGPKPGPVGKQPQSSDASQVGDAQMAPRPQTSRQRPTRHEQFVSLLPHPQLS